MIEECLEKISHFLGRLSLTVAPKDVVQPLRKIFLLVLVDVLKILAIATAYMKRGGLRTPGNLSGLMCRKLSERYLETRSTSYRRLSTPRFPNP